MITRPAVHPWAWWVWALGTAAAVSLTTNPLLLALTALAVTTVILLRRSDAPWARSVGAYFVLAGVIIGIRLFFQILLGAGTGTIVLFTLPEVQLPVWAAGIRLGGPVSAEALSHAFNDALRLGVMLLCLGAANALANPRQALRSVPAALYEVSVAVVIALAVAPQLIESTQRVRRARQLRGGTATGWHAVRAVIIPVLADAVDRSLMLAAGMEARGFGRTRDGRRPAPAVTALLIVSMLAATVGTFGVISATSALPWAVPALAGGLIGTVAGLRASGRELKVTRYRPQPWTGRDTGLALAGGVVLATALLATSGVSPVTATVWQPPADPLAWPSLHPLMLVTLASVLAPLALTRAPAAAPEPVVAAA
ncbi:MAG: energy-coupling factor transporter transmembrane component T [Propioniciclava sp.]